MQSTLARYGQNHGHTALAAAAIPYTMRFYQNARRSARSGVGMKRKRGSRTRTMTKQKRKTSGIGVTFEHDRQPIYLRKKMPWKKKRSWVQFNKKVNAVAEKELGTRTIVFNGQYNASNTASANHGVTSVGLYTLNSNSPEHSDLNAIAGVERDDIGNEIVDKTTKCIFQSGVLDITLRNTSKFTADQSLNSDCTLETDIYELFVGRVGRDSANGSYVKLQSFFDVGSGDTADIRPGFTGIQLEKRGCTPFDVPAALSRNKIKVLRKTKYFIRNGQQITYQYRDPKRHVMSYGAMQEMEGCNKPGMTKFILIVFKAVPGIELGLLPGQSTEQLSIGITRKYMYKIEGFNKTKDLYISQ